MAKKISIRVVFCLIVIIFCCRLTASAKTVVIVHPDVDLVFSKKLIRDIFLFNENRLPGGLLMTPVNLLNTSIARREFESKVLEMRGRRLTRFWAEKIFSGTGSPPIEIDTEAEIKKMVAENKGMIGYIEVKNVDDSVRVVHSIDVFTGR